MASPLFDSHIHSKYSFDGQDSVMDICLSAAEKGASGIAITDHCELGIYFTGDWRQNFAGLSADVAAAREALDGRLRISFGIELGQPMHDYAAAREVLSGFDFDVVLGSVHNVRDTEDFYFLSSGENSYDMRRLLDLYFEEQLETVKQNDLDILAHLTYAYRYLGRSSDIPGPRHYEELLREIFTTLARNGKALEVNCSGIYKIPPLGLSPGLWEVKLFRECGGEYVTLGSDAHRGENVTGGLAAGREMLLEAGFKYQTFFYRRKPEMFRL